MTCAGLGKNTQDEATGVIESSGTTGSQETGLRAVLFRKCPVEGWKAIKIMTDGRLISAKQGSDIDTIAKWLKEKGFENQGVFLGEPDEQELVVVWLRPNQFPEDLEEVLNTRTRGATAYYVTGERRIATTLTADEIRRRRKRYPNDPRDLQFAEKPSKTQLEKLYGISL